MEFLKHIVDLFIYLFDFFMHLDKHLAEIAQNYGKLTYGILFLVIFCETGLVVTPFLPGDSLLFAVGALTGSGVLPYHVIFVYLLLTFAALLGDNSNYWIGRVFGENVFGRFMNKKYLDRTHEFYEKHGVLTLVLAQFVPFIRTFAPFVAGVGHMTYGKFLRFNFLGVISWTTLFIWTGYFFGNLPFVKKNFSFVILGIILISVIPIFIELAKQFRGKPAGGKK